MIFSWLRDRRRRKLLAEPFPIRWEPFLRANVWHYALLSEPEQSRLRDIARVLIAEKPWEGVGGLYVSEEMKVTIAAQAALLLLGMEHDYFARVESIVVHPTAFRTPQRDDDWEDDGLSDEQSDGMSERRGPVLVSWDTALSEGRDPDSVRNIVIHEFAHQLDDQFDLSEGSPSLGDRELESRWKYVMTVAYEDHRRRVRAGDEDTFFTEQAADNPAEFFADASEAFYCAPLEMRDESPEVYRLLAAYYRVDPARWFPS